VTFQIYNGTKNGYFHRDYSLVEANSFEEAIEKIESQWSFDALDQVFVVNTKSDNGRLYKVTPTTGVKLELAAT